MNSAGLARIQALSGVRKGPECAVGLLERGKAAYGVELSAENRKTLQDALAADPSIFTSSGISKWLDRDCGVRISGQTIARHRRRECRCV